MVSDESCYSSMGNEADHVHHCELPAEHSDYQYDGYHQCECGESW
jgi:hypothetical protein